MILRQGRQSGSTTSTTCTFELQQKTCGKNSNAEGKGFRRHEDNFECKSGYGLRLAHLITRAKNQAWSIVYNLIKKSEISHGLLYCYYNGKQMKDNGITGRNHNIQT